MGAMQDWTLAYAPLFGRILVGGFFLWNGIQAVLNLDATVGLFIQSGLPQPAGLAVLAAALEVVGGIALVVGFKTRLSAILLAIYLVLISTLLIKTLDSVQTQTLLEHMAIIGGLLYICAYGSGRYSGERWT